MWYKTESNVKPEETDTLSSSVYNYDRRNITEEKQTDQDGKETTIYVYEECKIAKAEWQNYLELKELKEKQALSDSALQDALLMLMGDESNV